MTTTVSRDETERVKIDGTGTEAYPPARVAWYAITVLALSVMFAQLDLGIVGLLLQPIKHDLGLTDVQISLLLGFAFSIFYTFIGLPAARFIDRNTRTTILAIGIATWSLATAFCGIAQGFWALFFGRVMVGAGESVNGPATYSLIADYFPKERLPRAIATMQIGVVVGGGVSYLLNAYLIHRLQDMVPLQIPMIGVIRWWQLIFLAVGLPGLIVCWLMTTVKEPPRRGIATDSIKSETFWQAFVAMFTDLWEALVYIFGEKRAVFAPQFLSLAIGGLGFGALQWMPAFYMRTYGWSISWVAAMSGLSALITMPIGLVLGVRLSEYFTRKGYDDAYLRVVVGLRVIGLPASILTPMMPSPWLALGLAGIGGVILAAGGAPLNSAMQVVTPNRMRGKINALYLFVYSVVGTGIAPTITAMITQYVFHAEDQLRWAILLNACTFGPLSLAILWLGVKAYGREVGRIRAVEARA